MTDDCTHIKTVTSDVETFVEAFDLIELELSDESALYIELQFNDAEQQKLAEEKFKQRFPTVFIKWAEPATVFPASRLLILMSSAYYAQVNNNDAEHQDSASAHEAAPCGGVSKPACCNHTSPTSNCGLSDYH